MFENNSDEKKLDWMYKGPASAVDREEYLLGRSVDKSLDQLNEAEKSETNTKHQKNHVEHECIPPSIRDFKNLTSSEQVDLQQKLQEDPLFAIKKQEEDTRRRLLHNPVQLKKLQEALKSKSDKSKKKNKKSMKDNIDSKLAEKYFQLKDHINEDSLKKKKDVDLDEVLLKKFKMLKQKLGNNIDEIFNMDSSSVESEESNDSQQHNNKRKKKKLCSKYFDSDSGSKNSRKKDNFRKRKYSSTDSSSSSSSKDEEKLSRKHREKFKKHARNSSDDYDGVSEKKKLIDNLKKSKTDTTGLHSKNRNSENIKIENKFGRKLESKEESKVEYRYFSRIEGNKREERRTKKGSKSKRDHYNKSNYNESAHQSIERNEECRGDDKRKNHKDKSNSNKYDGSSDEYFGRRHKDKLKSSDNRETSKKNKTAKLHKQERTKMYSSNSSENNLSQFNIKNKTKHDSFNAVEKIGKPQDSTDDDSSSSNSDTENSDEEKRPKKINYGLVKADGSKIPFTKKLSVKEKPKIEERKGQYKPEKYKIKKLSELEKEELRKEMMQNAKLRDIERETNVKKYKEQERRETESQNKADFNSDFLKEQLRKSTNTSTVESRIKSNIYNIQRSKGDMNTHFSRRY